MGLIKDRLGRTPPPFADYPPDDPVGPQHGAAPHGRRPAPLAARTAALLRRLRTATPAPDDDHAAEIAPLDDADLNRVHLTGQLGCEPRLTDVGDHPLATLRLVSVRTWRAADGQLRRATDWYQLVAWEGLAAWCGRCLHAGDHIYAEGRLCRDAAGCYEILLDRLILLARPTPPAACAAVAAARQAA